MDGQSEAEYKLAKELFVANAVGSSVWDVLSLLIIAPVFHLFRSATVRWMHARYAPLASTTFCFSLCPLYLLPLYVHVCACVRVCVHVCACVCVFRQRLPSQRMLAFLDFLVLVMSVVLGRCCQLTSHCSPSPSL